MCAAKTDVYPVKGSPPNYDEDQGGDYPGPSTTTLIEDEWAAAKKDLTSDIYDFSEHVKINYDEVFGEPDYYHNRGLGKYVHRVIRGVYGTVYDFVQTGIYYILTLILGLPLGILWGLLMGLNQFSVIWLFQPMLKLTFVWMRASFMPFRVVIRGVLDPLFQAFGQMLSFIKGRFRLNVAGINFTNAITEVV